MRLAREGATVLIWDINAETGADAAAAIEAQGGAATFMQVDTAQHDAVADAARELIARFGRIDVLINNAGIVRDALLPNMSEAQFDAVIDVNLKGVFNCTKAVCPAMMEQRYGRIVNASSVVGVYGNVGQSNYVAAKAALIGMTKGWAKELGRYNITVNAIAPGFVETDMLASVPPRLMEKMQARIPLGRLGRPEELAAAYAFLASPEAAYISGQVLGVDGALSL